MDMTRNEAAPAGDVIRRTLMTGDVLPGVQLTSFAHRAAPSPGVLVFVPAMGASGAIYANFGAELARRGCDVVIASLRNAAPVRRKRSAPAHARDFGYHDLLEVDLRGALACVRAQLPGQTLFIGGHSLGGQLAMLYSARNPGEAAGVVLVAACSVYYRGWAGHGQLRVLAMTQLFWLISECLGYFPGRRFGFAGDREARGVMRDWAQQARTGRYHLRGGAGDDEALLAACALPVLSTSFDGDGLAPRPAVDHLCEKLRAAALTRIAFPGDPSGKGRPHFRWLRAPGEVAGAVAPWLRQQAARSRADRVMD